VGRIKVGRIKVVLHRPLEGSPKTATIRRTATGKWCVSIVCQHCLSALSVSIVCQHCL